MTRIPNHLDTTCKTADERTAPRDAAGFPIYCDGTCGDAVRPHPLYAGGNGRYYITIGHPGFNSPANNGQGYATRTAAEHAIRRYHDKGTAARAKRAAELAARVAAVSVDGEARRG